VARAKATENDWRVYYDRAAELRAVTGDPFRRHVEREALRERVLMIGSTVLFAALVSAFYLLTAP
jgi:hypothetical protein